jgi:hypothetical protein
MGSATESSRELALERAHMSGELWRAKIDRSMQLSEAAGKVLREPLAQPSQFAAALPLQRQAVALQAVASGHQTAQSVMHRSRQSWSAVAAPPRQSAAYARDSAPRRRSPLLTSDEQMRIARRVLAKGSNDITPRPPDPPLPPCDDRLQHRFQQNLINLPPSTTLVPEPWSRNSRSRLSIRGHR